MEDLRHDLHEEHDANDAERIGHGVAEGHHALLLGDRLCRGERGRGREGAGEDAGGIVGADAGDEREDDCADRADQDDDRAEGHVGLRVSFQVVEEVRPGDEADARDEQDKADAFDEFIARDGSGCAALDVELRQNGDILQAGLREQIAAEQRHQEHARRAEADALDLDTAERIADERDEKRAEQHDRRRAHAKEAVDKIHFFFLSSHCESVNVQKRRTPVFKRRSFDQK